MIPEIKLDTIHAILGSGITPKWFKEFFEKLKVSQPVLFNYLITDDHARPAAVGAMVYRMIESQMETNALEDLFAAEPAVKEPFSIDEFIEDTFERTCNESPFADLFEPLDELPEPLDEPYPDEPFINEPLDEFVEETFPGEPSLEEIEDDPFKDFPRS